MIFDKAKIGEFNDINSIVDQYVAAAIEDSLPPPSKDNLFDTQFTEKRLRLTRLIDNLNEAGGGAEFDVARKRVVDGVIKLQRARLRTIVKAGLSQRRFDRGMLDPVDEVVEELTEKRRLAFAIGIYTEDLFSILFGPDGSKVRRSGNDIRLLFDSVANALNGVGSDFVAGRVRLAHSDSYDSEAKISSAEVCRKLSDVLSEAVDHVPLQDLSEKHAGLNAHRSGDAASTENVESLQLACKREAMVNVTERGNNTSTRTNLSFPRSWIEEEERLRALSPEMARSRRRREEGELSTTRQFRRRVSQALSRLPDQVRQFGVTTQKQSPTPLMYVSLNSTDSRYDTLYLRNYLTLNVKDELSRLIGIGNVGLYGAGDYAMRIWLDPNKLATRNLTATDVVNAVREQNVQFQRDSSVLSPEASP